MCMANVSADARLICLFLLLETLESFFRSGSLAGIQPSHAARLTRLLARLAEAKVPHDMNLPGWSFHRLAGPMNGHFAVSVSGNWRLTFKFENGDAFFVDYLDYH